jgi:methylmalonyl-CoA mutase cobalamin-binding subunit
MGLPPQLRKSIPRETGPRLECLEEWLEVGQVVPIQPHAGDFMIGFPNSVENTEYALRAGITTIGNLSQYFAHQIPGWTDDVFTTVESVKALSMLAAFKNQGALVHSYLDDGYGALFTDYATVVGWVMMEKYIIEDLIEAKLAPSFGGMTADPKKRFSWILILKEIFGESLIGSMFYGDTISYTSDFHLNLGIASNYLLWDILAQLYCPTGHAITPIPVTEAIRIPTPEEILQIQVLGRKLEDTARNLLSHCQFEPEVTQKERLVSEGKKVFSKALEGLEGVGIDIRDPVRLLYILKKLGPGQFESFFGAGDTDPRYLHQRKPVLGVDYYQNIFEKTLALERMIREHQNRLKGLKDRKIVITSTDVHEHALYILERVFTFAGMKVFNIGAEKNPDQILDALIECGAEIMAISTHNGMAYEFAKALKEQLDCRSVSIPVFMGGRLNQNVDGEALPVDVSGQLKDFGINPSDSIESLFDELCRVYS